MSGRKLNRGLPMVKGYSAERKGAEKTETKESQRLMKRSQSQNQMTSNKQADKFGSMGSIQLQDNKKRLFEIDFGDLEDVNVPGFRYSKYNRKSGNKNKSSKLKQTKLLDPTSKAAWEDDNALASTLDESVKKKSFKKSMQKFTSTVLPKAGDEMPKNSLEGIQYFARYGHNGAYKFLYCIHTPTVGDEFRPYDLIVVTSEEAINREHYVMSPKGLIRNIPGQPSDFISLEDWVRGSMNFNVIRSMKSFKMHRAYKSFSAWSKYTRQSKFRQKQNRGVGQTFLANPSYCESVFVITGLLQDLESVGTIEGFKRDPYLQSFNENDYVSKQRNTREVAKGKMEKIMERIIAEVEKTSKNIQRLAGEGNDPLATGGDKHKTLVEMGMTNRSMNKNKSITAVKEEELARKRMKKTVSKDSAALCNFIRFVDYMTLKSFFNKGEEDATIIRDICHKVERVGFFLTTLSFKPGSETIPISKAYELGMSGVGTKDWMYNSWPQGSDPKDPTMLFKPSEVAVQNLFSHTLEASHLVLSSLPRIINMPFFNDILKRNFDALKITDLLNNSKLINENKIAISKKVKSDFIIAASHTISYTNLRGLYDFSRNFDKDMFSQTDFDYENIKKILNLLDIWSERIQAAKAGQACGVIHIESKTLQDELSRVVPSATYAACDRLQNIARDACLCKIISSNISFSCHVITIVWYTWFRTTCTARPNVKIWK
eukprot:g1277.t1